MTTGAPRASSTFMLTGKRVSRSESRNRLSISSSGSTVRARGSSTRRMSSANSSRTSPSSGAFLLFEQTGQLFDQIGLLHLVGHLGDDDAPKAAPGVLACPTRPQAHAATAGFIHVQQRGPRLDDDAARWEVGTLDMGHEVRSARLGIVDQQQASVDQFAGVVRRDRGGHAHGDAQTSRWPEGWGTRREGRPAPRPRRHRWRRRSTASSSIPSSNRRAASVRRHSV